MEPGRRLAGQVGLLSGGGSGLGLEIARALAREGMALAVLGRTTERVVAAAGELGALAGPDTTVLGITADVTSPDDVRRAVDEVRSRLGPPDLLVNAAAVVEATEQPLWEADPDEVWQVVTTALRGPLLLDAAVLGPMVAVGHGRIVTIASRARAAARSGTYTGYAVGKRAATALTEALAQSLAGTGVVVLDVLPGLVHTPLTDTMAVWQNDATLTWDDPAHTARTVLDVALGRHDDDAGRLLDAVARHGG